MSLSVPQVPGGVTFVANRRKTRGGFMSVEQKVKQIIVEQLGVDEAQVDPTASFVDDLGMD